MKRVPSAAELLMPKHLTELGIVFEREYQFAKAQGRKWRADFAIPKRKILIEIDGGIWVNGRHTRAAGFAADCEKFNAAAAMGFVVYRFLPSQVCSGYAKQFLSKALLGRTEWHGN